MKLLIEELRGVLSSTANIATYVCMYTYKACYKCLMLGVYVAIYIVEILQITGNKDPTYVRITW